MRKKNKSDSYQHKIVEISVDPSILSEFPLAESLGSQLNLSKHSERFDELRDSLLNRVLFVINCGLTGRQAQVITLRLEGKTQIQIAEELGIHQTTVHKTLMGNIDYANNKKCYGGAIKKLRKLCNKDVEIQVILEEMESIRAKDGGEYTVYKSRFDEGFGGDFDRDI
jgi:predicted transcriptional regulator